MSGVPESRWSYWTRQSAIGRRFLLEPKIFRDRVFAKLSDGTPRRYLSVGRGWARDRVHVTLTDNNHLAEVDDFAVNSLRIVSNPEVGQKRHSGNLASFGPITRSGSYRAPSPLLGSQNSLRIVRRVSTTLRQSAKEFSEYSFLENPMRRVC